MSMLNNLVPSVVVAATVVIRFTTHATQQGGLGGIPPTGKQVAVSTIEVTRIDGGKIVEDWGLDDRPGMLQQLGLVPA